MLTERDLERLDPLRIDREIARAAESLRGARRQMAAGDFDGADPFATTRLVAGKAAFGAVSELPSSDPLREPLRAWIYRLTDQRVNLAATARVEMERRVALRVIDEPEHARLSLAQMLDRALADRKRRELYLLSFAKHAGDASAAVALLWERKREVATRLGLAHPDELAGVGANAAGAASAWLDRTASAFEEIAPGSVEELVSLGLAESAAEGWPRHLLPRTILELFRETDLFRSVDLDPGRLPTLHAPSSFLRAFARVGAAWVDATAPKDQPFVVAHDPGGLARRKMGALLGSLPASPAFARRALGIDGARVRDHSRVLSASLLLESRVAALRVLLGHEALGGRRALAEAYEACTHRALGFALPPSTAGVLVCFHDDDAQRFCGMLLAVSRAVELRNENDDDWYRNPRTSERLRDEARLSPERTTTNEALEAGARALEASLVTML